MPSGNPRDRTSINGLRGKMHWVKIQHERDLDHQKRLMCPRLHESHHSTRLTSSRDVITIRISRLNFSSIDAQAIKRSKRLIGDQKIEA